MTWFTGILRRSLQLFVVLYVGLYQLWYAQVRNKNIFLKNNFYFSVIRVTRNSAVLSRVQPQRQNGRIHPKFLSKYFIIVFCLQMYISFPAGHLNIVNEKCHCFFLINLYSEDDWNVMNVSLISIYLSPELIWTCPQKLHWIKFFKIKLIILQIWP